MLYGLRIEQRNVDQNNRLSNDLANHLLESSARGRVVVVANKPVELLSSTRKQWLKNMRKAEVQLASTLNPVRQTTLEQQTRLMRRVYFTTKAPRDRLEADITFGTAETFLRMQPTCKTLYVTNDTPRDQLYLLAAWMPPDGSIVIYEQPR